MQHKTLYIKVLIAILFGLVVAYFAYLSNRDHYQHLLQISRSKDQQDLASTTHELDFKFRLLYQGLESIARMPGIQRLAHEHNHLDSSHKRAVQAIYNNLVEDIKASEVYVIPMTFNPNSGPQYAPIYAFEGTKTSRQDVVNSTHSFADEKYEYEVIFKQLLYFKKNFL